MVSEQVGDRLGPASNAFKFCDKTTPSICVHKKLCGRRNQGEVLPALQQFAMPAPIDPQGTPEKPGQRHRASLAVAAGDPPWSAAESMRVRVRGRPRVRAPDTLSDIPERLQMRAAGTQCAGSTQAGARTRGARACSRFPRHITSSVPSL